MYILERIMPALMDFFGPDEEKIKLWLDTPNPQFGGISPMEMMLRGRGEKLLTFVLDAKEEWTATRNEAPEA